VLSLPVQVISLKDSSPKWRVMCRAGHKTLLTRVWNKTFRFYFCFISVTWSTIWCTSADQNYSQC